MHARVMREIMEPVIREMARRGTPYRGVLYAGLILAGGRPSVLEFNVRLGDPEAQVVLARLRADLLDLFARASEGRLAGATVEWDPRAAACVVLAAEGYPGAVERGRPIDGLEGLRGWTDGVVFHAATRPSDEPGDRRPRTDGGRVLGVTALGQPLERAVAEAYAAVARIHWPGMHYRRDIGHRALGAPAAGEGRAT
jgi:phosphoribosylamine--glycine ligase